MFAVALVGVADSLLTTHRPTAARARHSRVVVAQARVSPWTAPINVEAPGVNGGDPWAGARGSDDDLQATAGGGATAARTTSGLDATSTVPDEASVATARDVEQQLEEAKVQQLVAAVKSSKGGPAPLTSLT